MQEEIDRKVIALSVSSAKMTGRVLVAAIREYLRHKQNKQHTLPKGRQSIKQLVESGAALSNIEITEKNIRSFEPIAKKYGLDYALKKDTSTKPPHYLVFFKGKDADVITMAFKEYSEKIIRQKEKPSIRKLIINLKELVKQQNRNCVKVKEKDRDISL